jgi:hypothetical protein
MKRNAPLKLMYLEKLLQVWRDHWFVVELTHHRFSENTSIPSQMIPPLQGPAKNWKDINSFLLKGFSSFVNGESFLWLGSPVFEFHDLALLPIELKIWLARSKRVFHLGENFLNQIQRIRLDEIQWEDLTLPYQSFAMALDKPIQAEGEDYNFVLVSNFLLGNSKIEAEDNLFLVRLASKNCLRYEPIPRFLRKQAEEYILKRNWRELSKIWTSIRSHYERNVKFMRSTAIPLNLLALTGPIVSVNQLPEEVFWGHLKNDIPPLSEALRLIAHLCLFLEHSKDHLSKKEGAGGRKEKHGKRPPKKFTPDSLSQDLDVFEIGCVSRLGPDVLTAGGVEKEQCGERKPAEPHWRRSHKRRRPRTDPSAPKEIQVKGAPVNFHLLLEGSVLRGGKTVIQ